jgi:tetratricopeptide (TPR) repeat protein
LPLRLFGLCLIHLASLRLAAAEQGQLDASPALFSVLAAINVSGYNADVQCRENHPLRDAIRNHLAGQKLAVVDDLKAFFAAHKQKTAAGDLSQYVSYALSTDGPPDFKTRFRQNEIPPDVLALEGFGDLMKRFHKDANLDSLWQQSQPAFDHAISKYHEPVSRAVLEVNGYLRNITSGYVGRRFQIYIDLLGAPAQIHTRSYADEYFVVVTPAWERLEKDLQLKVSQTDEIRHAYLHYLLDPLVVKFGEPLESKKPLIDYALGAPLLGESYKSDFTLLVTESLIKGVEARLTPPSRREAAVDQSLKEGFILTPFFSEQLPLYEKQEQAMRLFFPEIVKALELKKEVRRLDKVEFAVMRPSTKACDSEPPPLTGATKTLDEAEQYYIKRDLANARKLFLAALSETDVKSARAKAYYGLARIATLENDPERAQQFFRRTLELEPEPAEKAWTLVYLGRLSDAAGENEQAAQNYQSALAVDGGSAKAREAATKGLQGAFRRKTQ